MILLIIFAIFIIGTIIYIFRVSRFENSAFIITSINACFRQHLPLSEALEHAAKSTTGKKGRILFEISRMLTMGWPLGHSIHASYRGFSSRALGLILAAEQSNQLPRMFESLQAEVLERARAKAIPKPMHPAYPFIILGFATFIVLGLAVFIVPQMESVFADLNFPYPKESLLLLNIMTTIWNGIGDCVEVFFRFLGKMLYGLVGDNETMQYIVAIVLLFVFMIGIFIICKFIFRLIFHRRNPLRPGAISTCTDLFKWSLPIFHKLELKYSQMYLAQGLRMSLRAGRPVDSAIANSLLLDVNRMYHGRIKRWLAQVQNGRDIAESARACRIGPNIAWAFDNKIGSANTIDTLELLENSLRQECTLIAKAAEAVFWPMVTLFLACVVAGVIYMALGPVFCMLKYATLTWIP